jgi:hypothetical protein
MFEDLYFLFVCMSIDMTHSNVGAGEVASSKM